MNGHTVAWVIETGGYERATVTCHEPLTADCHRICDCEYGWIECDGGQDCADYGHEQMAESHCTAGHVIRTINHCNAVEWLHNDGVADCYGGDDHPIVDGPINIEWGEGCMWSYPADGAA